MAGKLPFLIGLGAGYVLGTRSGRERYDQMVGKVQQIWQDPRVQDVADRVQHQGQQTFGEPGTESR